MPSNGNQTLEADAQNYRRHTGDFDQYLYETVNGSILNLLPDTEHINSAKIPIVSLYNTLLTPLNVPALDESFSKTSKIELINDLILEDSRSEVIESSHIL